ncbi:hypothetical protein LTR91_023937 [Friedmanniomyces endolithicus]|uniref:Uncharacterized protein n=1 Tax=Friedmanniomyces endolithicus TaxID=329885 RepID=A0AAN6H211_9PEZI|nr:hypothetical protein LTR94_000676 [Friedmanniomyces endolithicus]KAK0777706.1 hypothetical protein LTR38_015050 [Friedmanniomyces endolithicus]KAK0790353.1 hypothetical protein LTR59_009284 [Friedmanniomyces endolithicus]KAK0817311.1 hypothetical protein LTR75_003291 [Friedmanniomyces endolithicus]KAK0856793.1 hypothetical protein LTR03_001130 [Friedmanniomyces endolithicus]
MPSTASLNPGGQVFESVFKEAWKLFGEHEYPKANELCLWLIMQSDCGRLHRAGAHLILAHSPDQYVHHAKEALRLYEALHVDSESEPTEKQRRSKATLIAAARAALKKAEADAKVYADAGDGEEDELDEEELKNIIEEDVERVVARMDKEQAAMLEAETALEARAEAEAEIEALEGDAADRVMMEEALRGDDGRIVVDEPEEEEEEEALTSDPLPVMLTPPPSSQQALG